MGIAAGQVLCSVERFQDAYDEARPLLGLHWNEIAKNKELLKLNPDDEMCGRISDNIVLVTARAGGRLVGYFMWLMVNHPHYKHVRVAEEDLHFLLPEFRRGLTGYNLIKAACKAAFDSGADLLIAREKIGHEHTKLMGRLGFAPTDIVYTARRV